jgi:hypothetical protein
MNCRATCTLSVPTSTCLIVAQQCVSYMLPLWTFILPVADVPYPPAQHTFYTQPLPALAFRLGLQQTWKTPLCFKQSTNNATNSHCQLEIQLTRQTLSLRLSQRTLYHTYNGNYLSRDDHVTCQCCATGNTDKQAIPSTPCSCLSFRTKSQQMWSCNTHSTYTSTC